MRQRQWLAVVALLLLPALSGCRIQTFRENGSLQSDGQFPNRWRGHPQGCTRDPFDGRPVGESKSIVTLLWGNPALYDPHFGIPGNSVDAPLRLEFLPAVGEDPGSVVATLHTIYWGGIVLDKSNCSRLELKTEEQPPDHAGDRSTLSGELELDCREHDSHLTAKVRFQGCEY